MYYIGVDLGGTGIKVGLLNDAYKIIQQETAPTLANRPAAEIIADMAGLCKKVMEKEGITEEQVHSIGIGSPGIVSPKDGVILFSSNLQSFENVQLREEFKKHVGLEVYVENDANCAALGEAKSGAAKGADNVAVITLGTGVGGGLIIDGHIYGGSFFAAGEVGHHVVNWQETEACGCGRKGCWEQYASATALIRDAKKAATAHPASKLVSMAKDAAIENINAKVVFDAAQAGDEVAQGVLDNYFKAVAHGVTNIINIMQPGVIVLGGGMSAQGENLTAPVIKHVKEQMYGALKLESEIKTATLGNDAGIIGAALIGVE